MTAVNFTHYTCDHEAGMCDAELVIEATKHGFDVGVAFGRAGWTFRTSPGWEPGWYAGDGGLIVKHYCPAHSGGAK